MINEKIINALIDKYFNQDNILAINQIDSYNDYIENILPMILSQCFPLDISFTDNRIENIKIEIVKLDIEKPRYTENNGCTKIMTPSIARLRNFTYSLTVFIDLSIKIRINDNNEIINLPPRLIKDIVLTKIPVVVKSNYCNYFKDINSECSFDCGGYSIINGNEKVIISQEKITPNIIHVYRSKANSKYAYVSELRSSRDTTVGITKIRSIKKLWPL